MYIFSLALLKFKEVTDDRVGTYFRLPDDPDDSRCKSDVYPCDLAGKTCTFFVIWLVRPIFSL